MNYNPEIQYSTQKVFVDTLIKLSGKYRNMVVLTANAAAASGTQSFAKIQPERHFNFGNGVSNMLAAAAGFTIRGKVPFVCTYALAASGGNYEQIRNSLGAQNLNVKIAGTHAGLLRAEEGIFHQALEDIALMRSIPNMKVVCPADAQETKRVVMAMMNDYGPTYLRLVHVPLPDLYGPEEVDFEFGKGHIYKQGTDICIFSYGIGLHMALSAAAILEREGLSTMVINMSSIQPLDEALIVECAKQIPHLVTIEDHQTQGGLGSAVAEVLMTHYPAKVLRLGMEGFGESGKVDDLFKKYNLDAVGIVERITQFIGKI